MLVKFFQNKSGGSVKAIDYLLNHRVDEGSAIVLKGYPSLTRNIIKFIKKKQKVCIGCLSFEESDIDLNLKIEIMDQFEKMIFGENMDEYNILWVQHRDKGRLELNFVIPKINLNTQKSFNPYWHKKDFYRVDRWQNEINLKFGFSNPKDPQKEHFLKGSRKTKLDEKYIELEKSIKSLHNNGKFKCRDDVINFIKNSGFLVSRIGKDYISVKHLNSKKSRRFKGEIFSNKFMDLKSFDDLKKEKYEKIKKYQEEVAIYESVNSGTSFNAGLRAKGEGFFEGVRSVVKSIDQFRRQHAENERHLRQYVKSTNGVLSEFMERASKMKNSSKEIYMKTK
ncbi:relaxase/mobilization nuclease domain-containing protein [Campylobacter corcagiensis]|uniref:Relaxase/mobilization nuclease domain-containing protein n=1 Tax=Campylobacter corcagiensis TaxID=1448857 RepID=A0A7M1LDR8_9BACT|nr:relaxase/mobilization nuclease domain-containing protein [Campylobacter corcagiensis]QKF65169.1 relaxase/mobilization domain-containing protein [Campylobacter corcagiensis]QOQ86688.1 relaxase/mobilization nuclease domain-containing protein [Campylobacter corcagiensis]